ncbi:MAG: alpha/beta hydrolase fold domain-containing protein [Arenicellales bacterium]|jgi:acetyl esterase|nr:alpha/beta hydrolase fold domain-containing protein [Arenicellales bacterium]MDP6855338.1 alpha/beta hydrolase fold domain-containing protein [Arenicellales bacterium]
MPGTDLDPQMMAVLEKQRTLAAPAGDLAQMPLEEIRRRYELERSYWNAGAPDVASVRESTIKGPVGDIALRCYLPTTDSPLPVLVYLHGGGWVVGSLDSHDRIMRRLAADSGAAVVGVNYSLSPEYKFPVALEETTAVIEHLQASGGELGVDGRRLALGGDSAGANMAVSVAQAQHAANPGTVRYLLLYYGGYGLPDSVSRRLFGGADDGMSTTDLAFYRDCYLRSPGDAKDSRVNVLAGNIAVLPPAFIGVAQCDPLRDDSLALNGLMAGAGIASELRMYQGVLHGFLHYGRMLDKANTALKEGAAALGQAVH